MSRRYYPALVIADKGQSADEGYGVVFPDFPGCISDGNTVLEALEEALEALVLHVAGMTAENLPIPEPAMIGRPDWLPEETVIVQSALIPIDLPDHIVRANITMDQALLKRIDTAAAQEGFTRSGYLAQAARERLQRSQSTGA
jgi:predicted RNase H-like HicB family nuclease